MAQYINKDDLVAEIRRRLLPVVVPHGTDYDDWDRGANNERVNILSYINTLEAKEVDLDFTKEVDVWVRDNGDTNGFFNVQELAKHFFELGLKTQKGE